MNYFIYVNYNKKVEAYERPLVMMENCDEYIERIKRDFRVSPKDAQEKIAEYEIAHVGFYNDNTGVIELINKNVIFDCATLLIKGDADGK